MKRLFLLMVPIILIMLAFRPMNSFTVSGTVSDETGSPLPGVSIQVKGTRTGVATSNNGTYKIVVPNSNNILVFSGAGLETKEVQIAGQNIVNMILKRTVIAGTEVVVTAMGQKREAKELGYSVISPMPGKIAGLNVQSVNNGGYGDSRITLRGTRTVTGDEKTEEFNTEGYDHITENQFLKVTDNPLSTFSIDVDAASYSNVRRFLNLGQLPPSGAVRIEEMINYFHYDYPQPTGDQPFSINTEISDAPWNKDHKLVLISLQGKKIPTDNLPASNLVFLIDVSGSMLEPNKLPLVQASLRMLVDQLREQDKVSIVVYAGAAGLVLPATSGANKTTIKDAIDKLEAGGSTAGGAGIKLAYKIAKENFSKGGNNRVILCTDGDFNVGASSDDEMESLIEEERKSGVYLTVLGYGMGNYKDSKMQKLADKGNGNHAYIDGISEAKKVLVNEFGGTLFTIAKDVKLQVEFNPAKVQGYRLIGYENRMLAKEDFNDDKKDAGELGSGHTVTALYEVIPVGVKSEFLQQVDTLKYQHNIVPLSRSSHSNEIMTVKFRYKAPDGEVSKLIEHPVVDNQIAIARTSDNFRFAASVSEFGMLLRNSGFKSNSSFADVLNLARNARGNDDEGYRSEFIRLVESAQLLTRNTKPVIKEDGNGEGDK